MVLIFSFANLLYIVDASPTVPVSEATIINNSQYLIPNWNNLSFKTLISSDNWIQNYVNPILDPEGLNWDVGGINISMKCLSYSASTSADWHNLQIGRIRNTYTNILNNRTEIGYNPRELEQIYFDRVSIISQNYDFFPFIDDIFVTHEDIPYDIKGYFDILINPPKNWIAIPDSEFNNPGSFVYTVSNDEYFEGYRYAEIDINQQSIKNALKRYGILYGHLDSDEYLGLFPIHAVTLIGYGVLSGTPVFYIHDTYDQEYPLTNSKYKAVESQYINELIGLYDPNWFTYHHDNRRTGTSTLKGDVFSTNTTNDIDFVIVGNVTTDTQARPSIADVDQNDKPDVVVSVSTNLVDTGIVYAVERSGYSGTQNKWKYNASSPVEEAPTIADTNNQGRKEVVFGLDNGLLYVLKIVGSTSNENAQLKWRYNVSPKSSVLYGGSIQGNLGFTLVANIDNDPKKEIIFTDGQSSLYDWPGTLYVLEDSGSTHTLQATTQIGKTGGGRGAVSTADIDNDNLIELVVPAFYEIRVYDVSGSGSLSLKWNTSARKTEGSVAIYDVDNDNAYELIYTTSTASCTPGGCANNLIIRDAATGTIEHTVGLSIQSRVGVAIANLDSDSNPEIVINGRIPSTTLNQIQAYDAVTESLEWSYPSSGGTGLLFAAPNIADIDGDGRYDILLAKNTTELLILNSSGSVKTTYSLGGAIGSSPVVGDIDDDGVAEIAVKRAGSPISILTMTSDMNVAPLLNLIDNVTTARVGEIVNLNLTGGISANDLNGNSLNFSVNLPFNSSFQWIPMINDTGTSEYYIFVSDGSLTDAHKIEVHVFDENTTRISNFTDVTSKQLLNFTGIQNKTLQIRIPKNASILYTSIKLEGRTT